MKRKIAFILAGVLCLMPINTVQASEDSMVYIESEFTDLSESTVEIYPMLRGTYLLSATSAISNPAIGYVGTSASTYAATTVASVSVEVYLQRYSSGSWTTVASWSESMKNSRYASGSRTYTVSRGYYYRVYSVHTAYTDSNFGATSGIYIS